MCSWDFNELSQRQQINMVPPGISWHCSSRWESTEKPTLGFQLLLSSLNGGSGDPEVLGSVHICASIMQQSILLIPVWALHSLARLERA